MSRERSAALPHGVQGAADPRFSCAVNRILRGSSPGRRFGGGALSVYLDGVPVVDVWTGWSDREGERHWNADTGTMVFSATKGMAVHRHPPARRSRSHRLRRPGRRVLDRVRRQRQVARHGSRPHGAPRRVVAAAAARRKADLMDHVLMEERMAAAPMGWMQGRPAYHALTYGWLMSGLARAVTGRGMRELVRTELAGPLDTDGLHLGRPPADAPTQPAEIIGPQARLQNPIVNFVTPRIAALPVVRRSRRAVLPGNEIRCAGRYVAAGRRDSGGQRRRDGAWAGPDVRRHRQRRSDRRQAVPVRRTRRGTDRPAQPAPRRQHVDADGVPSRLPRAAAWRPAARLRTRRPRRIAGLGRPGDGPVLRVRAQPTAHAVRRRRPGRIRRHRRTDPPRRRAGAQGRVRTGRRVRRTVRGAAAVAG